MALRHSAMLEVNEFLVLDYLRQRDSTTRPEIGHDLGLSASSVSRIVGRLLRGGLVVESGTSSGAPGRPRTVIAFNPQAGAVIAVDLGGTRCHAALADLAGQVLAEDTRPSQQGTQAFEALLGAIEVLSAEAAARGLPVAALAVGVPAILDPDSGRGIGGPNVAWVDFEIVGRLTRAVDVPFTVENDVNLAALAHAWRGEGRQVDDFVTISIGTGIGGAIVADGRLVKGRHNAAGELGYLIMDRAQLHRPRQSGLGALESVASGPALARRARELLAASAEPSTLRGGNGQEGEGSPIAPERTFAAAAAGDALAGRIVTELLEHVAITLVAAIAAVDPALIILEGSIGRALEPYLADLRSLAAAQVDLMPEIRVSRLGPTATVTGAIAAALQLARERSAPMAIFGAFSVDGGVRRHG